MKEITVLRNKEIYNRYKVLTKDGMDFKDVLVKLSKENDIGESYVKNILNEYGVNRNRKSSKAKSKRDSRIIEMYMNGDDHSVIADKIGLTTTRVGQIIRGHLGKYAKSGMLEKSLINLKKDIADGMDHKAVQDKYGASTLRKIKSNLGYNAFDACLDKRNKDIRAMYESKDNPKNAAEIATAFGLTRDRVYGILHDFGIRSKSTRAEYRKRNEKIVKAFKDEEKSSKEIAAEHSMTVTNVNIILKNHGARE